MQQHIMIKAMLGGLHPPRPAPPHAAGLPAARRAGREAARKSLGGGGAGESGRGRRGGVKKPFEFLSAKVGRHSIPLSFGARASARGGPSCALCLRL